VRNKVVDCYYAVFFFQFALLEDSQGAKTATAKATPESRKDQADTRFAI
jgi:hypothetical protein